MKKHIIRKNILKFLKNDLNKKSIFFVIFKQQRENSLYRITRTSQYYFKSEIISMTPRRLWSPIVDVNSAMLINHGDI